MPRCPRCRATGAFAVALLLAATPPLSALGPSARSSGNSPRACLAQDAGSQDPRPHCCFVNPRYVGTCDVEPAKDETCASILEYLNNPMSQGKPYCNSTNIRGGWKSEPCEPGMKGDSAKAKPE
jgi:hypothetical protein